MAKFNAEQGWKTAKTITLGAGVLAGSFFLIRFFINKMAYGNSQDKSLKAAKNAHSYATELNIALANDRYFTLADKDEVLKILYEIPAKFMEEVKSKYHILTSRKRYLNDDLRKLFNIDQYRLVEELIRKKIEDAKSKKKKADSKEAESPAIAFNPKDLANHLHKNASEKNLQGVIAILQQIKDTVQYGLVSNIYKEIDFWGKTIVNDLLSYAFKDNDIAKPLLKNEFLRIGLKVNPYTGTWSLNGLRA